LRYITTRQKILPTIKAPSFQLLKDFVIEFLNAIGRTVYLFSFCLSEGQTLKIYVNWVLRSMLWDQEGANNNKMKKIPNEKHQNSYSHFSTNSMLLGRSNKVELDGQGTLHKMKTMTMCTKLYK
jgi:hypothetical protein